MKYLRVNRTQLFDQNDFYEAFEKDLRQTRSRLIIESPFLTTSRVGKLTPILRELVCRGVKVIVNTKLFDKHDEFMYYQAIECVVLLQELGVKVLFTAGHHRKLAVIDEFILWEGSLNILSQNNSCEIKRRTKSKKLCRQMVSFVGIGRLQKRIVRA